MREYAITGLALITTLAIGFALLIYFGVAIASYFAFFIVIASILGSIFYEWWRCKADKTIEKLKVEILNTIEKNISDTEEKINKISELIDVEKFKNEIESLRINLIKRNELKNVTLTRVEKENRKIEQRLRSLEAVVSAELNPKLEEYIEELKLKVDQLLKAGFKISKEYEKFNKITMKKAKSLRELIEKKEKANASFNTIIKKCVQEIEELSTYKKAKIEFSEEDVFSLVNARRKLVDSLTRKFENKRKALRNLIIKVSKSLDEENRAKMELLLKELDSLPDAGYLPELEEIERKFKEKTLGIVEKFAKELEESKEALKVLPKKLWTIDKEALSLASSISISQKTENFVNASIKALAKLTPNLKEARAWIKVMESYTRVEPLISTKLKEKNEISAKELKLKHAEKFLMFYAYQHKLKYKGGKLTR